MRRTPARRARIHQVKLLALAEGTTIVIDGATGELIIDPPATTRTYFRQRAAEMAAQESRHRAAAGEPAFTVNGTRIEVAANLGSRVDARGATADGADSAGLVRTEFLFLNRDRAPDLQEQVGEYLAIAEAMGGRRVTFRTLDVGGDKPLASCPCLLRRIRSSDTAESGSPWTAGTCCSTSSWRSARSPEGGRPV